MDNYLVVMDSCGEMTQEMESDARFVRAPLTIDIDAYHIVDDETFDQQVFLKRVAASENCPKSACPSPEFYQKAFEQDAQHIFAVTLSAELSGSYNSAQVGRSLALETCPDKQIYVFNSRSASIGETLIAIKIRELEEQDLPFEQIIEEVEKYIASQTTWFVLESLETLRKNGRLTNLKAMMASVLNIKPIMISTPSGSIAQLKQVRGINQALTKMVDSIVETAENASEKILAISHCNCPDRARMVKDAIKARLNCRDILILDTAGISSMYANDGGIIVVI